MSGSRVCLVELLALVQPLLHAHGAQGGLVAAGRGVALLRGELVAAHHGLLVALPLAGVLRDVLQQTVDLVSAHRFHLLSAAFGPSLLPQVSVFYATGVSCQGTFMAFISPAGYGPRRRARASPP